MKAHQVLRIAPLLFLLMAAPPSAMSAPPEDPTFHTRSCGTIQPTGEDLAAVERTLRESPFGFEQITVLGGTIQVAFHVIHNGVEGNVTDAQIQAQIVEMNRNFAGLDGGFATGYTFVLSSVDRTLNTKWFTMTQGSALEKKAKEALAIDPLHRLNIYTCKLTNLGFATLPFGLPEASRYHGVVVHYGSLPGGSIPRFNLGRTATHETAHYLGLYHTFSGGCTQPNDGVADTPPEASATSGCPEGKDTCAGGGLDPIHNYMDYSDDACYTQFTAGQDGRMDQMVATYKPNLLSSSMAQAIARVEPAKAAPLALVAGLDDGAATLEFELASPQRVELAVHDVAGRRVAVLVDGTFQAGVHRTLFDAASHARGVYFAVLRTSQGRVAKKFVIP